MAPYFLLSDLGSDGLPTNSQLYFENDTGELISIHGSPNPNTSLTDYMEQPGVTLGNALALYDNKIQSAPAFYQNGELAYVYNPESQGWDQIISAAEREQLQAPPLHPEYTYNPGSMREYLHTYTRILESGEQISLQIPIRIAVYDRWYVQSIDFKEPVLELMTESWLRSTHYMLGQMGIESTYDEYLQLLKQGTSPQIEGVSIENGEVHARPYRIGDAACFSCNLLYGRDGAGESWPKRGAIVPRRLALLLRKSIVSSYGFMIE